MQISYLLVTFLQDILQLNLKLMITLLAKIGVYRFKPELLSHAHKWCQNNVAYALDTCDFVIVANTNLQKQYVDAFVKIAKDKGADYEVRRLNTSFGSVHNVPDATIERMRRIFEDYSGETVVQ